MDTKKYELKDIKTGNTMPVMVTEELQQSLLLQQERLRNRGLLVGMEEKDVTSPVFIGGEPMGPDGTYMPGCFESSLKRITKYRGDNQKVVTLEDNICRHFYVMDTPGDNSRVSSVDVIYEGMSYDRSKEYIEDKHFKQMKSGVNLMTLLVMFLWAVCTASGLLSYATFFGGDVPGWASIAIAVFGVSLCGSMTLTKLYGRKWTLYHRRARSRSMVEAIRKEMPEFCMEKLVALMDSRFNKMVYSENPEELGVFLDCDISGFRKNHENVIHMERTNFWIQKYWREGDNLYMNLLQSMYMTEYKDQAINREVKDIRIQLIKPENSIMSEDFYEDWYVSGVEVVKDMEYEE